MGGKVVTGATVLTMPLSLTLLSVNQPMWHRRASRKPFRLRSQLSMCSPPQERLPQTKQLVQPHRAMLSPLHQGCHPLQSVVRHLRVLRVPRTSNTTQQLQGHTMAMPRDLPCP